MQPRRLCLTYIIKTNMKKFTTIKKDVRARGKFWRSEYQAVEEVTNYINSKE